MSSEQASSTSDDGQIRSRTESLLVRLKLPKISMKLKQRYNMSKVTKLNNSSSSSSNNNNNNNNIIISNNKNEPSTSMSDQRLECGRVLAYFKRAFDYSSSWCTGTPTLKQCSWSQMPMVTGSTTVVVSGDEHSSSYSSTTASDSGVSSGDDISAESSPKLRSCRHHSIVYPVDVPDNEISLPPVKPPRLLKRRRQSSTTLSIGILSRSSTIPVLDLPHEILRITDSPPPPPPPPPSVVIIQPPSPNKDHPIRSKSPIIEIRLKSLPHYPRCLGLEISGGIDVKTPVVITHVADDSPVKGKVHEGDFLWSINGHHAQGLKNAQVLQLLAEADNTANRTEITLSKLSHSCRPLEASMAEIKAAVQSRSLASLYQAVARYDSRLTHSASKAAENLAKNRYNDIVAYDSTRITLTPNEFNGQSDYINANHVNMTLTGSHIVYRYIATQGPKASTVSDFWQMVLEQGSRLIVMLTTLHEGDMVKCFKYWPDEGDQLVVLGVWNIRQWAATTSDAWILRQFSISNELSGEERQVTHVQYVKWPDHGVPHDSQQFVDFVHLVREFRAETPLAPVVVHCSAGIGRTGVLIIMETAMGLIEMGQAVRPQHLLQVMREQRPSLVQTEKQFSFVVGAILRVFEEGIVTPRS